MTNARIVERVLAEAKVLSKLTVRRKEATRRREHPMRGVQIIFASGAMTKGGTLTITGASVDRRPVTRECRGRGVGVYPGEWTPAKKISPL